MTQKEIKLKIANHLSLKVILGIAADNERKRLLSILDKLFNKLK